MDVHCAPLGARAALDGEWGAVHVVLGLAAELAGPCPGVRIVTGGDVGGDLNIVFTGAGTVLGRAASLDGQDDRPAGRGRGLHVGGQGDLAGATTVDGRASEGHLDRVSCGGRVGKAIGRVESGRVSAELARVVAGREGGVVY